MVYPVKRLAKINQGDSQIFLSMSAYEQRRISMRASTEEEPFSDPNCIKSSLEFRDSRIYDREPVSEVGRRSKLMVCLLPITRDLCLADRRVENSCHGCSKFDGYICN